LIKYATATSKKHQRLSWSCVIVQQIEVDVENISHAFGSEKHFSLAGLNSPDLPNAVCLPSLVPYL